MTILTKAAPVKGKEHVRYLLRGDCCPHPQRSWARLQAYNQRSHDGDSDNSDKNTTRSIANNKLISGIKKLTGIVTDRDTPCLVVLTGTPQSLDDDDPRDNTHRRDKRSEYG